MRPPIGRLIAAIGVPGTRVTSVNRSIISERKPFLDALEERIWKRLVPWCTGATDQWNAQTCQTDYMNDRQYEIPTEIAFASKARIETTLFEAKMHLSIDRKYVGHAECPSIQGGTMMHATAETIGPSRLFIVADFAIDFQLVKIF